MKNWVSLFIWIDSRTIEILAINQDCIYNNSISTLFRLLVSLREICFSVAQEHHITRRPYIQWHLKLDEIQENREDTVDRLFSELIAVGMKLFAASEGPISSARVITWNSAVGEYYPVLLLLLWAVCVMALVFICVRFGVGTPMTLAAGILFFAEMFCFLFRNRLNSTVGLTDSIFIQL